MAEWVVIDEWHVVLRVPKGTPDGEVDAALRVLRRPEFRAGLLRAVRRLVGRHPALAGVRVRVAR